MSQGKTSIFICDERKLINKDLYDNVYLASFGENLLKLLFGQIQLIGPTCPKFDV